MSLEDFKLKYKAARVEIPLWAPLLGFAGVGIIDVAKALHRHDISDVVVSAILWLFLAPLGYIWSNRKR